jgi:hypothetical protein
MKYPSKRWIAPFKHKRSSRPTTDVSISGASQNPSQPTFILLEQGAITPNLTQSYHPTERIFMD